MKTFYRKQDGHTYYEKEGALYGAPTSKNGKFDTESEICVDEFAEPLTKKEIAEIKRELRKFNNESDFFSDWTTKKLKDEYLAYWQMIYQINCYGTRDIMAMEGIGMELESRGIEVMQGEPEFIN